MIGYVTLGTNNLERAATFYDALFAELGASRLMEHEGVFIAWGIDMSQPSIGLTKPYNGEAASVGNGTMVAIHVDSTDKVDAFYKKAIELGGTDEGEPGPRGEGFYGGYFRDTDGNKLNFFTTPKA